MDTSGSEPVSPLLPQPVGVVDTPHQPPVGVVVPPQPLPVVQHDDDDDDSSDDDMDQGDQAGQPLPRRFPRGIPLQNPGRQV